MHKMLFMNLAWEIIDACWALANFNVDVSLDIFSRFECKAIEHLLSFKINVGA